MTIYLDHNATSPLRAEVREHWWGRLGENLGNPSSLHARGRRARDLVDEARERVAAALGVPEPNVVFTPSGSSANGLALLGGVRAAGPNCGLVTTTIEHAAVLEPAQALEEAGHPVEKVRVDRAGRVEPAAVAEAVGRQAGPCWVSVMAANNEIGSCPQIAEIGRLARSSGREVRVHTDAVQALGKIQLKTDLWKVDAMTLSPHKVGGPVGIGVLVIGEDVPVEPLVHGGGQERGLVGGTEDAPRCSAAALAIELAVRELEDYRSHCLGLIQELWERIRAGIPGARLHGPELEAADRLPNTLNVGLPGVEGRVLVTRLDLEGLATSAGSACASGAIEPSHVLLAMGYGEEDARAALRLSIGRQTTREDIERAADVLARVAQSAG